MEERKVEEREEGGEVARRGPGRRGRFGPEQLAEIFVELCKANVSVGQVMRKWGLHSTELRRIRERGHAILERGFRERQWNGSQEGDPEREALQEEKRRLEEALAQQTIELQLLKKKTNSDWPVRSRERLSARGRSGI